VICIITGYHDFEMDAFFELQAFVSLLVLLAAAFIALLCDYMRGANDVLREENIEMRVRQRGQVKGLSSVEAAPGQASTADPVPAAPAWYANLPQPKWLKEEQQVHVESEVDVSSAVVEPVALANTALVPVERAVLRLPAGYYPRFPFKDLALSRELFTGVVVSIGANAPEHLEKKLSAERISEAVRRMETMLSSLLGPEDFGCRAGENEFVLVYPRVIGSSAQQKLAHISERLWDFQLRTAETANLNYSWGAVEVRGEEFAESAASASERMYQSRRSRKTISMDRVRRSVVNL